MRRLFIALNCLLMALAGVVLVPAWALADMPPAYTSFGYASGVHVTAGSDAFPNFQNGAVYNRYPLAEVQQDASPSSSAVATYADSGPLAATGGSQYNQGCSTAGNQPPPPQVCQNPNNQVPYATSNYPGGPAHAHVDSCSPSGQSSCPAGGPRGDSDAAQFNADASGYYAGGGTQPFSGASGQTTTSVGAAGSIVVTAHSEVQSFGIGNVRVSKVVVDVTASSTVSGGSGDAHVEAGSVTVNGQPVTVTDQGVTIQDRQVVPCSSVPQPPAPPQAPAPQPPAAPSPPPILPGGLPGTGSPGGGTSGGSSGGGASSSSAGKPSGCVPGVDITYIKLYTVAPAKTVDGSHVTVWATGLHVVVTHPTPGAGVPQQTTEYVLGEGFADTTAGTGGAAFGFGGLGGFGGFGGMGGFGGFGGGFDQGGSGVGGPGSGAGQVGAVLAANRVPLALTFLTLEALLLGSAAAWVWARNTPVERAPDEVLSP